MKMEPMSNDELLGLSRSLDVLALPESILHRVKWALLQAHAANQMESLLDWCARHDGTATWYTNPGNVPRCCLVQSGAGVEKAPTFAEAAEALRKLVEKRQKGGA